MNRADPLAGLFEPITTPSFAARSSALRGKLTERLFGFRNARAVGDADLIAVPVRRRLVAIYSRRRVPNIHLKTKAGALQISALLLRSAAAEVACHPDEAQVHFPPDPQS
jgi:hypothetical protein